MTTSTTSYGKFQSQNGPSNLVVNRNGEVLLGANALPSEVGQHWIPSQDNVYDLGQNTTPKRWRDLYLSRNANIVGALSAGSASISGTLIAQSTAQVGPGGLQTYNGAVPDVGSNSARFGTGYFTNLNATGSLTAGPSTVTSLTVTGDTQLGGLIRPDTNGTRDLGASNRQLKDLYFTGNLYKNGVLYNPGFEYTDLNPSLDDTYVLGNGSFRWKNVIASRVVEAGQGFYSSSGNLDLVNGNVNVTNGNIMAYPFGTVQAGIGMFETSVRPVTGGSGQIGLSGTRWAGGWFGTLAATDSLTTNYLYPDGANKSIGAYSNRWLTSYTESTYTTNVYPTTFSGAEATGDQYFWPTKLGASDRRWGQVWTGDLNSWAYADVNIIKQRGPRLVYGPDDVSYNDRPVIRGVIDGTVHTSGGTFYPSRAAKDYNGITFPYVTNWCSDFSVALFVYRIQAGKYHIVVASIPEQAQEEAHPEYRGLPRNGSVWNGGAYVNPRVLPVVHLSVYNTGHWKSTMGFSDNVVTMCVRDILITGDETIPNGDPSIGTPLASWGFTVQTSNGQDALFAFEIWSGCHGQVTAKSTDPNAIWVAGSEPATVVPTGVLGATGSVIAGVAGVSAAVLIGIIGTGFWTWGIGALGVAPGLAIGLLL
jgi:hypothetical protein